MPSDIFKQPKRTKKAYKKRAKVFARQYDYSRKKTALYQSQLFYSYGAEYGLIGSLEAIARTVKKFNDLYQDNLTGKHAVLLLAIKHYCTLHKVDSFHPEELRTFYLSLQDILGFFVNGPRPFRTLFNDLTHYHFVNPQGYRFSPTTRVKLFSTMYANELKTLFSSME